MIVLKVVAQNAPQMALSKHNYMIQALSTNRADETLDISILPGTLEGRDHFLNFHPSHSLTKILAVDPVSISDEETRCSILGKGFYNLLRCPAGSRMFCDIKVQHSSAVLREHHEDKQHTECSGWHL